MPLIIVPTDHREWDKILIARKWRGCVIMFSVRYDEEDAFYWVCARNANETWTYGMWLCGTVSVPDFMDFAYSDFMEYSDRTKYGPTVAVIDQGLVYT